MVLPVIEVSHLPSSSSYFAAILQPLGLVYINPGDISRPVRHSVVFGSSKRPVLEIRQVLSPDDVHRPVHLVFTAPTRTAVANFHQRGIQANPSSSLLLQGLTDYDSLSNTGCIRATVIDMDGNRIEAVYPGRQLLDDTAKRGTRDNGQSWTGLVDDVLECGQGVCTPAMSARGFSQCESSALHSSKASRRTAEELSRTFSEKGTLNPKSMQSANTQDSESKEVTGTISTSTVVGTLLGLAAGAVLAYGIVSSDKHETSHHHAYSSPASSQNVKSGPRVPAAENEGGREPGFSSKNMPVKATAFQHDHPRRSPWGRQLGGREVQVMPRLPPGQSSNTDGGWVKPQAFCDITNTNVPAALGTRGVERGPVVVDANRARNMKDVQVDDVTPALGVDNHGSVRLSSSQRNTGSLAVPSVSSRPLSNMPTQVVPSRALTATFDAERETYVSARSRVSSSSLDQTPRHVNSRLSATAEPLSRVQWMSPSMSHVSARRVALPETINSSVSPRDVPLPASSCADWEADNDSIAPSDSISCVGRRGA